MMTIGITQRLLVQPNTGDTHDALSHDWQPFLSAVGIPWVPLPNGGDATISLACELNLTGLIFSGGGDTGKEPPRDYTEAKLWHWAQNSKRPILGICRGFQAIQRLLGGELEPLNGHVAVRHSLFTEPEAPRHWKEYSVNSYHNLGIKTLAPGLTPLAFSNTATEARHVEAAKGHSILGLMWHPEREPKICVEDVMLIRHFFASNSAFTR